MSTKKELAGLSQFLKALESREMFIYQSEVDVTQREIDRLRPEIKYLESVLARTDDEKLSGA
jgi:hypothetical protein